MDWLAKSSLERLADEEQKNSAWIARSAFLFYLSTAAQLFVAQQLLSLSLCLSKYAFLSFFFFFKKETSSFVLSVRMKL